VNTHLGVKQRAILALVIEQGGSLVAGDVKMLGADWTTEWGNVVRAIEGLINRGFLTCDTDRTYVTSTLYVTPEGRRLIPDPLQAVSEVVTKYAAEAFDAASARMMKDVEVALQEGKKVCLVVVNDARRKEVRRATRHKLGDTSLLVLTPRDAKLDWLTLKVPGDYEAFVEPSLLKHALKQPLEYLGRYERSNA